MNHPSLHQTLKKLHLSGLASTVSVRLQEAAANRLSHVDFLELALQDELNIREQRKLKRRVVAADFRQLRPLDEFDWGFNPTIDRKAIFELATGQFVREHSDVLFVGPPGVGKTFLAQAIAYEALKMGFTVYYRSIFDLVRDFIREEAFGQEKLLRKYLKPELLLIDDMGLKSLPKNSAEYLLEVIMRRYENRSTIMTSNRPLEEWGKLLGDATSASAILDRFLHHARSIVIRGKSYRLKNQTQATHLADRSKKKAEASQRSTAEPAS